MYAEFSDRDQSTELDFDEIVLKIWRFQFSIAKLCKLY